MTDPVEVERVDATTILRSSRPEAIWQTRDVIEGPRAFVHKATVDKAR